MAQNTQIFGNTVSLDILSNIIEISSAAPVMYGDNEVMVVQTKKISIFRKLFKR